jgi:putative ABC transport system substrate-binding protein
MAARAQQRPVMPVVGVVDRFPENGSNAKAFRQGLADGGIIVGRDAIIEHRQITAGRSNELVLDLVQRGVAVIVAAGGSAVAAMEAKAATSTTPIVFAMGINPVVSGLVASLSHPGGNVTGVTFLTTELGGKRLDLLHKLVPQATKVGYLSTTDASAASVEQREDIAAAARALRQELVTIECEFRVGSVQNAFMMMVEAGVETIVVHASAFLLANRGRIVALAAHHKLPAIYPNTAYATAGGLISYSADVTAAFRLVGAQYVARILKGARPADLPVQQPTKFELVINLKTARVLGLEVPPNLLALADEVID